MYIIFGLNKIVMTDFLFRSLSCFVFANNDVVVLLDVVFVFAVMLLLFFFCLI